MQKVRLMLSATMLLAATTAQAQSKAGCYERTYDAAHLAASPKQKVQSILFWISGDVPNPPWGNAGVPQETLLKVRLRGESGYPREISLYCKASAPQRTAGTPAQQHCRPSFGGAPMLRIAIAADGQSATITNTGIKLNAAGYSAEDLADNHVALSTRGDDRTFRLPASQSSECRY